MCNSSLVFLYSPETFRIFSCLFGDFIFLFGLGIGMRCGEGGGQPRAAQSVSCLRDIGGKGGGAGGRECCHVYTLSPLLLKGKKIAYVILQPPSKGSGRKDSTNRGRKKKLHEDKRETYAQEKRREECFFVPVRLRGVLMHSYFFFSSSSFSDRPTFPDSLLSPH